MAVYRRGSIKLFFRGDPTLKGYYPLEGLTDYSGNSKHFINTNGAAFLPLKFNIGVKLLRASVQYLSIADNIGISNGSITMGGWIKLHVEPSSTEFYTLFSQFDNTTQTGYRIGYAYNYGASGVYRLYWYKDRENLNEMGATFDLRLSLDRWYFILLTSTIDGTDIRGYLDGKFMGAGSNVGVGTGTRANLFGLGVQYNTTGNIANAFFDEVFIFTRVLSSAEISAYYNWAIRKRQSFYASILGDFVLLVSKIFQGAYDQFNFVGRISLWAKDQRNFIGKITLFAKDIRSFIGKTTLFAFEILGLATATAKIKAVVKDIKVRFRVKQ